MTAAVGTVTPVATTTCTHGQGTVDAVVIDDVIEVCAGCGLPGRWPEVETVPLRDRAVRLVRAVRDATSLLAGPSS